MRTLTIMYGAALAVGVEGEMRFLNFLTDSSSGTGIKEQNFLGGPRVTYQVGRRWLPYGKFLSEEAGFTIRTLSPTSSTLIRPSRAAAAWITISRIASPFVPPTFEYQHWDFPPTGLTPWVYSAGVSYRIF